MLMSIQVADLEGSQVMFISDKYIYTRNTFYHSLRFDL